MPVGRAVVGCLVGLVLLVALMVLARQAIFMLAPPRDDASVAVASAAEASRGPVLRHVLLSRSRGLDGELPVGEGRVQVALVIAPGPAASTLVLNAASPVEDACPVEIGAGALLDCVGRRWTFAGEPFDAGLPPLQRFRVDVRDGAVFADLTAPLSD